jgi:cytidine deaminase
VSTLVPEELHAAAAAAAKQAYAPYSGYRVGAVVVASDGRRFSGVNVENVAFGATICAEGNAISTAAAAGVRKIDVVAVAGLDSPDCTPCGNCRQLMGEFGVETVVLQDGAGGVATCRLEELLPLAFSPDMLGPDAGER